MAKRLGAVIWWLGAIIGVTFGCIGLLQAVDSDISGAWFGLGIAISSFFICAALCYVLSGSFWKPPT